jgi:hypothetical protein
MVCGRSHPIFLPSARRPFGLRWLTHQFADGYLQNWRLLVKHLIAALALTTLVASPALAQSWDPSVGSGNIAPAPYGLTIDGYNKLNDTGAADAFAQVPRRRVSSKRHEVEPNYSYQPDYSYSEYHGSDF